MCWCCELKRVRYPADMPRAMSSTQHTTSGWAHANAATQGHYHRGIALGIGVLPIRCAAAACNPLGCNCALPEPGAHIRGHPTSLRTHLQEPANADRPRPMPTSVCKNQPWAGRHGNTNRVQ